MTFAQLQAGQTTRDFAFLLVILIGFGAGVVLVLAGMTWWTAIVVFVAAALMLALTPASRRWTYLHPGRWV